MWLRRLITFGLISLALGSAIWAELEYQPTISSGHQHEQHSPNQISGPGKVAIFSSERFGSIIQWTETHHDFVIAIGTVFLALFTLALFGATWGLLRAAKLQASDMQQLLTAANANAVAAASQAGAMSRLQQTISQQGGFLRQQARATARNANIAERSLVALNRPYLLASRFDNHPVLHQEQINADDPLDKKSWLLRIQFEVIYQLVNYGRSLAEIHYIWFKLEPMETLPEVPPYLFELRTFIDNREKVACSILAPNWSSPYRATAPIIDKPRCERIEFEKEFISSMDLSFTLMFSSERHMLLRKLCGMTSKPKPGLQ
jgi:hypothetical protein